MAHAHIELLQSLLKKNGHSWSLSSRAPQDIGFSVKVVNSRKLREYKEATVAEYTVYGLLARAQRRQQTAYEQVIISEAKKWAEAQPEAFSDYVPEGGTEAVNPADLASLVLVGNDAAMTHVSMRYPALVVDAPVIFNSIADELAVLNAETQELSDACLCYFINSRSEDDAEDLTLDSIPLLRPSTLSEYLAFFEAELNPPKEETGKS